MKKQRPLEKQRDAKLSLTTPVQCTINSTATETNLPAVGPESNARYPPSSAGVLTRSSQILNSPSRSKESNFEKGGGEGEQGAEEMENGGSKGDVPEDANARKSRFVTARSPFSLDLGRFGRPRSPVF